MFRSLRISRFLHDPFRHCSRRSRHRPHYQFFMEPRVYAVPSHAELAKRREISACMEENGQLQGVCALEIVWADLAEVKSLAVDKNHHGRHRAATGGGRRCGSPAVKTIGFSSLTSTSRLFEKLGFCADKARFCRLRCGPIASSAPSAMAATRSGWCERSRRHAVEETNPDQFINPALG